MDNVATIYDARFSDGIGHHDAPGEDDHAVIASFKNKYSTILKHSSCNLVPRICNVALTSLTRNRPAAHPRSTNF
jgi:hypothetical protein